MLFIETAETDTNLSVDVFNCLVGYLLISQKKMMCRHACKNQRFLRKKASFIKKCGEFESIFMKSTPIVHNRNI